MHCPLHGALFPACAVAHAGGAMCEISHTQGAGYVLRCPYVHFIPFWR